jgi:hypothetical protein
MPRFGMYYSGNLSEQAFDEMIADTLPGMKIEKQSYDEEGNEPGFSTTISAKSKTSTIRRCIISAHIDVKTANAGFSITYINILAWSIWHNHGPFHRRV